MQIFRTNSDISTPEKLAMVISDQSIARYRDIPEEPRKLWLGSQIYALCLILHYQPPSPMDVEIDANFADQMIMDDESVRSLKQVEMQEAFRRGIAREYGDFYGITASTLVQFLRAYRTSEKRAQAITLLYNQEQKELKEKDARFWEAIEEARRNGYDLPLFLHSPMEDDRQHQERIARQREEILKAQNNETEQ